MNITEVRVKLTMDPNSKLKGYCSVTLDDAFVVRDLKIIEDSKGPFVAMPSRKLADRGGAFALANANRFCQTTINLTGLKSMLPSYESTDAALQALHSK